MSKFEIYLDRLRNGEIEKIEETFSSDVLSLDEQELKFSDPIHVQGECYLTETHLIFHLKIKTSFSMPCSICNSWVKTLIEMPNFYHAEPRETLSSAIFDYSDLLRDALLLEVPSFVECQKGKCPERTVIESFLKKEKKLEEEQFPFSKLKNS